MSTAQSKLAFDVTLPTDTQIVMTRAFGAPQALVFDAFTNPEYVRRWLLGPDGWSMPECSIDLRAGGRFRYQWRSDDGAKEFGLHGTYRKIDAPNVIEHIEAFDGKMNMGDLPVTTLFTESDGVTTVTMTLHFATKQMRDATIESGMASGVEASFDRLEAIVGTAVA